MTRAVRDPDDEFFDSDEARPLRILTEYLQPLHRFRQERVHDTVVFFGSARLFSFADDPTSALRLLRAKLPTSPETKTPAFARSRTAAGPGGAP